MIRKTAIIIGASSEIGLAIAKDFAKKGFDLALTYNTNHLDFKQHIKSDGEIKEYFLNLADSKQIADVFEKVYHDFKFINTLVFCAGVAQHRKLICDLNDDEIEEIFQINSISAIKCCREFSKRNVGKHPSSIVLIGSFVEKNGCSCESVYTATKTALSGFCKSVATELGNLSIRCNVVAPGFIDTKMNNNLTVKEKNEIASMTPLQRLGTVDDIANSVSFLASDEASFITGQTIYIDGGLILD